jgi:ATP-binding cassette subfamily B (MDR/TAP) protein 1
MANMVDVFTLVPSEMINRGNFFAGMYVVLAGACLISYFLLGYGTNVIAQVSVDSLKHTVYWPKEPSHSS